MPITNAIEFARKTHLSVHRLSRELHGGGDASGARHAQRCDVNLLVCVRLSVLPAMVLGVFGGKRQVVQCSHGRRFHVGRFPGKRPMPMAPYDREDGRYIV